MERTTDDKMEWYGMHGGVYNMHVMVLWLCTIGSNPVVPTNTDMYSSPSSPNSPSPTLSTSSDTTSLYHLTSAADLLTKINFHDAMTTSLKMAQASVKG